jgi:hypothetical protein
MPMAYMQMHKELRINISAFPAEEKGAGETIGSP